MKYETYLKQLKAVTKLAKENGLSYVRSYAYKGPKVTRLKFWNLSCSKKAQKLFCFEVLQLPYVPWARMQKAKQVFSGYSRPDSITVYFK